MGKLLIQYKSGKMPLSKYEELVPIVAILTEMIREMEDIHIGFNVDGELDDQLEELEVDMEWFLCDLTDDECKIVKIMVNDEIGYEPHG